MINRVAPVMVDVVVVVIAAVDMIRIHADAAVVLLMALLAVPVVEVIGLTLKVSSICYLRILRRLPLMVPFYSMTLSFTYLVYYVTLVLGKTF